MVENLNERHVIAQRTMIAWCTSAAASGRRKYTDRLGQQRADKAESAEGVKRKALSDEIMALEKRQKTVQCAMMSMNKDADTLSEQAKAQNDMTHSVRASQGAE